ncbi:MAG: RdgB/HAM1 family non-canonical purine NTP pyrophosphatase [Azospirillum sp.]|nr:RdgB/HAM1 family non-canonical purine NTP pyrophosphatase [Azospirillum sp.]
MPAAPAPTSTGRRFLEDTLVVASHNRGKVAEIATLLAPHVKTFRSAGELGLPEPDETGDSFLANAELKARAATRCGLPALADDSGLVVPALAGRPGIHSARWGGPGKDFGLAMRRVETELADQTDRSAHFVCALALAWPDGHLEAVEGRVFGRLAWPPRGNHGFGYDPIFVADGHSLTFGEMAAADKHAISHRADAFRRLVARCFS